jgi:hypothetical protein
MSGADIVLAVGVSCSDIYQTGTQDARRPGAALESPRTWILRGRDRTLYAARVGASAAPPMRTVLAIESAT